MTSALREALERLVDRYWDGASLALLFDYDGTLVPIAENPDLAVLGPETRRRIERLARTPAVFVGVLSGRRIGDLKNAVGINGLYYAGTNGLELDWCGVPIVHADSDRAVRLVAMVADRVRPTVARYSGAWVEQKPLGLTVHYRHVQPDRIDALRTEVAGAMDQSSGRLRVLNGKMAIEMTPDIGWDKGSAVMMIVRRMGSNTVLPLYAGDDANDADAMIAVAALGGVAIGIGPSAPPAALYNLPDPASLGHCLDALQEMLAIGSTKPAR